jgi:hypothetical protein
MKSANKRLKLTTESAASLCFRRQLSLAVSLAPNANLCKLRNTETSCFSQDD